MRGETWYDNAQICLNGHVITEAAIASPEHCQDFCDKCGAETIKKCSHCDADIKGYYHCRGVVGFGGLDLPKFCHKCGKPYPWTQEKLKAAKDLSDEIDNIGKEDKEILKKSIDDLVSEGPQSIVATARFKKILAKCGKITGDAFRDILVDVLSEAVKKTIWGK